MKVKVLCRNPDQYLRETKNDLHKSEFKIVQKCELGHRFIILIYLSFSSEELRPRFASLRGAQRVQTGLERSQIGTSVCKALFMQPRRPP